MPIEIEAPEGYGYENIDCNLSESSFTDQRLSDLGINIHDLVLFYGSIGSRHTKKINTCTHLRDINGIVAVLYSDIIGHQIAQHINNMCTQAALVIGGNNQVAIVRIRMAGDAGTIRLQKRMRRYGIKTGRFYCQLIKIFYVLNIRF